MRYFLPLADLKKLLPAVSVQEAFKGLHSDLKVPFLLEQFSSSYIPVPHCAGVQCLVWNGAGLRQCRAVALSNW